MRMLLAGLAVVAVAGFAKQGSHAQQSLPYTNWDQYGGSSDSMQYSALAQINKSNVAQLQRAWFYPVPGEPDRLVFTVYTPTRTFRIENRPSACDSV